MFKRLGAFFLDILEVVVFAIGIFFFVYLLIMRPHKIRGESMHPNFPDGEYLLTQKVSYYLNKPQRGDVIVFKPPIDDDEYIKRIIALPGETIKVDGGKVYINGSLLAENYLDEDLYTSGSGFLSEGEEFRVPEGNWIVMGDNRPHSSDSRAWGPITRKDISGKAWLIYWPPNLAGVVRAQNY